MYIADPELLQRHFGREVCRRGATALNALLPALQPDSLRINRLLSKEEKAAPPAPPKISSPQAAESGNSALRSPVLSRAARLCRRHCFPPRTSLRQPPSWVRCISCSPYTHPPRSRSYAQVPSTQKHQTGHRLRTLPDVPGKTAPRTRVICFIDQPTSRNARPPAVSKSPWRIPKRTATRGQSSPDAQKLRE